MAQVVASTVMSVIAWGFLIGGTVAGVWTVRATGSAFWGAVEFLAGLVVFLILRSSARGERPDHRPSRRDKDLFDSREAIAKLLREAKDENESDDGTSPPQSSP